MFAGNTSTPSARAAETAGSDRVLTSRARPPNSRPRTAMDAARDGKRRMVPRLDPAALRVLAGGAVFGRGEEYARSGRVEFLSDNGELVRARVFGTEVYRVALRGRGRTFAGECSCPAFAAWPAPIGWFIAEFGGSGSVTGASWPVATRLRRSGHGPALSSTRSPPSPCRTGRSRRPQRRRRRPAR